MAKFIPKVVIRDDRPNLTTKKALISPQTAPARSAADAANIKLLLLCSRIQAKTKPVKVMMEGKERSISPATTQNTKLNPTIINSGKDRKIAE